MKNCHAAALSGALLFRKGSAMPMEFGNGNVRATIRLAPNPPRELNPNPPVRISVKLDRARRQHLQFAAARLGVSKQELLLAALDHYLRSEVPAKIAEPCPCLKAAARPEPV